MKDEAFFDTNIITYAFDQSDQRKRLHCKKLVEAVFQGHSSGYLSNQILGELYVVLTKGLRKSLPKETACLIVSGFIDSPKWIKVDYSHNTMRKALEDLKKMDVPFWDLLIAETMKEAGITRIYTENMKDFEKIPWIKVVNPTSA